MKKKEVLEGKSEEVATKEISNEPKQEIQEVSVKPNNSEKVETIIEPKKPEKKEVKPKEKKWYEKFFNKEKFKKSKKVGIIFCRDSGIAEFIEQEEKDGMFSIDDKIYHTDLDCIYRTKEDKIPLAIIREKDMTPLRFTRSEEETIEERVSTLQNLLIKGIRHAELVRQGGTDFNSKQITMKQVILYCVVALVAGAVLMNFV